MPNLNPVVIDINPPGPRFHLPKFPSITPRGTKIITAVIAIAVTLSMIAFVALSILSNDKNFRATHHITNPSVPSDVASSPTKSDAALPGGGIAVGVGGTTGTNSPKVTITADPASVTVGKSSKLKWEVTNSPKECIASEDWSGNKTSSGSEVTQPLTEAHSYLFTLTCKNDTGTGFQTVSVGVIAQGGTGGVSRPEVTLAATPSSIYTGDFSTLSWTATHDPTSCTASGDWSGAKSANSAESTGMLSTAKTYKYTLTCVNSAGSGYASTSVVVTNPPPNLPITFLSTSPAGVPVLPGASVTLTWTVTGGAAATCTASGDWSGAKQASGGSQNSGALSTIKTYKFVLECANETGTTNDTAYVQVLPNPPAVSLTASPSTIYVGSSATITWSATNSPTSCTATGNWTGAKTSSGTQSTGILNAQGTYTYGLNCTNAGGSDSPQVTVTVQLPPIPVVSISTSPGIITVGGNSTLSWSATNNPTSCTASGDWTGAKASSGTQNSGALNTVKTYTYTLVCTNAGGSGSQTASVTVNPGGTTPAVAPVVTISLSPISIGSGGSSTLSWSATNSPTSCTASGSWSGAKSSSGSTSTGVMATAGIYTYTLLCSNSAGSDTKSASLTVIAVPVVTVSLSPTSITSGGSTTITWNATNSPTSCTAGGSWTGSKAATGSQSSGTMSTAGSFVFSLSCTNTGGTGSGQVTLTVTAPVAVYCGGLTPCYGSPALATHAAPGSCWGWNTGSGSTFPWVIDITSFRPSHLGGSKAGSLEEATATCNHDIHSILSGTASIPGYKDKNNSTTFNHSSGTKNNTSGSGITATYRMGYYDATKP